MLKLSHDRRGIIRIIPEQLYVAGHFPWVFDVQGSTFATASELTVSRIRDERKCMVIDGDDQALF